MKIKKTADEISPITGKLTVLVDIDPATGLTSKLCMESGYTTNSFLKEKSKTVEDLEGKVPKVALAAMVTDNFGQVWLPMMQSTENAAIYPVEDEEGFKWQVTPIVEFSEEEKVNYPDPNNPGQFMKNINMAASEVFAFGEFEKAFAAFAKLSLLEENI